MAEVVSGSKDGPRQWIHEADYVAALKQLESLQNQINNLRQTVPALVDHFTPPPVSTITPSQLYHNIALAARQASSDVKKCRADWQNEKTRQAFDQARTSLANDEDVDWEFISKGRWNSLEGLDDGIEGIQNMNMAQTPSPNTQGTANSANFPKS